VTTSKSPRRVLQTAFDAASQALPAYRHKYSPTKFTQPQLRVCLVLKEFACLDYRGLAEHLLDHPDLGRLIGLEVVPHCTTFPKAAQRLLAAAYDRQMFDAVLERRGRTAFGSSGSGRRLSTAPGWSHATSAATSPSGRPTGIVAGAGPMPTSRRSSWWSPAPAT
jgi:hypothetical protein